MKEQISNAVEFLKESDVHGCITGSCLLGYFEGQDVDVFLYNEGAFNKLLYCLYYNPMFLIIEPLEQWKFDEYTNKKQSTIDKFGLISIKFKYNMSVDVNVILKKGQNNIFDVLSAFDIDIITTGIDIKTKKTMSLRESTGNIAFWNKWNMAYYSKNEWDVKRILRQFERCIKYTKRGFDTTDIVDKYISIINDILSKDKVFVTERGSQYFDETQKEMKVALGIISIWRETQEITEEQLDILKSII
jgi:hypothetical protein